MWGIGGGFSSDKGADFRKQFDAYWRNDYAKASLKFPEEGTVFDYFIDPSTKKGEPKRCAHWRDIIPAYKHDRAALYQTILVPTMDTTRIGYIANMMLKLKKPVMLVGNAGSAKTVLICIYIGRPNPSPGPSPSPSPSPSPGPNPNPYPHPNPGALTLEP